jgi:pimeloyl-ACP methyl ester carboxylesterase
MFMQLSDATLRTVSFGPGPSSVLALNGWTASWEAWQPTFSHLSTDWRCISYDTRGTGSSTAAPDSITLDALVDDVFRVLDAMEVETCVLAGESLGGFVATHAALRDPARFSALVLVAAPPSVRPWDVGSLVVGARQDYALTIRAFARHCLTEPGADIFFTWGERLFRDADPEVAARLFECCYGLDPDLCQVRVPTVVVHGDADDVVPVDAGRAIAAAIPGARIVELPGACHAPTVTRPA